MRTSSCPPPASRPPEPPPSAELRLIDGRYLLEEMLGHGAIGRVFRATNVRVGRAVAVKILRSRHATHPPTVARFMREARAAHRVRHPNVVDVLDVGLTEQGVPYMVQELLRGEDLRAHVARVGGRLPIAEALEFTIPVARALAHAHAIGIVHRDLKPENVFLACDELGAIVPKVVDFGISKVVDRSLGEPITETRTPIGTPRFMSPEQVQCPTAVDARSDVWAFGVMLYELLSGRSPFAGQTSAALLVEICTRDATPLGERCPGLPAPVATLVGRCLQRDRGRRFADAGELARALEECAAQLGVVVPPPRRDDTSRTRRTTDPSGRIVVVPTPAGPTEVRGAATDEPTVPRIRVRRQPMRLALVVGVALLAITAGAAALGTTALAMRTLVAPAALRAR